MTEPATIRTFDATGVASAQLLDVSNFQGQFDWAAAAPHIAGGIFKATEGTGFTDADAAWNHAQIRASHLHRGAYHFFHPAQSATTQARYFVAELQRLGLVETDMLWLDHETADGMSPAAVATAAQDFMTELHALCPHNPMGVYTYISFATGGNCHGLEHWPLWLAYPASTAPVPPPPWMRWTFWQWGQRNGVDADAFNGTKAALDAWIAHYGPKPPAPGPPPLPVVEVVSDGTQSLDVLAGTHNTTPATALRLTVEHGGDFPADMAGYVNSVFAANSEPVPVGAKLWTH